MILKVRSKFNDYSDNCWCTNCKDRIDLGTQYIQTIEEYFGDKVKKNYHPDCVPEFDDEEFDDQDDSIIEGEE